MRRSPSQKKRRQVFHHYTRGSVTANTSNVLTVPTTPHVTNVPTTPQVTNLQNTPDTPDNPELLNMQNIINKESRGLRFIIKNDNVFVFKKFMEKHEISYENLINLNIDYKRDSGNILSYFIKCKAQKIINHYLNRVNFHNIFNQSNNSVETMIHFIETFPNDEFLNKMLKHCNKDINKIYKNGGLIHYLIDSRKGKSLLKTALQHGANINLKNNLGMTPLYLAVVDGNFPIVKFLIKNGANLNIIYKHKENILSVALRPNGSEDIIKLLMEKGVKLSIMTYKPNKLLLVFAGKNMLHATRLIINYGVNVNYTNKKGENALIIASSHGYADIVKELILAGADINYRNPHDDLNNSLHYAVKKRKIETAKILLANNIDRNIKNHRNKTALQIAWDDGDSDFIKLLFESDCLLRKKYIKEGWRSYSYGYRFTERLGPYKNKLYVCYMKCRLMLCANKFSPESSVYQERIPKDILCEILQHYVSSIFDDICELKKLD